MRKYGDQNRKSIFHVGLEEIDNQTTTDLVSGGIDVDVCDTDTRCEDRNMEMVDRSLDKIGEVTDALESIYDAFIGSYKSGGFNKPNMHAVNTSVDRMCATIGVSFKNNYSLESFNNEETRARATLLALEGIGATIKEAFKKFIEMLKKAAEWVMDFFKNVFSKAESTKKKTEELQAKLNALSKSADKKESEMPAGNIGKELVYNGTFPTSFDEPLRQLTKQFDNCVALASNNLSLFNQVKNSSFNVIRKSSSRVSIEFTDVVVNCFVKKQELSDLSIVTEPERFGLGDKATDTRLSIKCSDGIIGGVNLIRISNANDLAGADTISILPEIKLYVAHDAESDKIKVDKIPVLSTSQMTSILADVIKMCSDIIGFKSLHSEISSFKKKLENDLYLLSDAVFVGITGSAAKRGIQNMCRYFINNLDQPIIGLCSHMLKVNRALLMYVDKSLAFYK